MPGLRAVDLRRLPRRGEAVNEEIAVADGTEQPDWGSRAERLKRLRNSTICPVHECGQKIPRTLLMCPHHWRRVPAPLKREVYASARRMWRDIEAEDGYRAWLEDALAAIEAVET
jgi:hypothetical protein